MIRCASIALLSPYIGDSDYFYSCGMYHFGLPECEAPRSIPVSEAADLMNRFNFWQIIEHPDLAPGHTFCVSESARHFRLSLQRDARHEAEDLFHNPHGIWRLYPA